MKKNIFYWSPCLNPVGTLKSTLNSALSLKKYNYKNEINMINVCGEWNDYKKFFSDNSINLVNLNFNYFKYLPKRGFISSRFSYLVIFILSFLPLIILLKKYKPDIIFLHLVTSLPLTILRLFNLNTEFILRISGYPKLNFLRKYFWKSISNKIKLVTCPSYDLKKQLEALNIFNNEKIYFLPDAIIRVKKLKREKKFIFDENIPRNKKIILSAGRLTKQKNFSYLINEFSEFLKTNDEFVLLILGDGEKKEELSKLISKEGIQNKVFLLGHKHNIYSYMHNSSVFVLSSLWEDPGFVIVEAALCNLFVISSNCPNGPKEFLDGGKRGILFESNKEKEISRSLQKFNQMDKNKIFNCKIKLKKEATKYTIFKHYVELSKILNS